MTPTCNFVARKVRPNTDLTFRICAPYTPALCLNLRHGKMVASPRRFFMNTTRGLVVMELRLCQENNRQPLIQRIVFANGLFEAKWLCTQLSHRLAREEVAGSSLCLTHT